MKWLMPAMLMLCVSFILPTLGSAQGEKKDEPKEKQELQLKEWKILHGEWRFDKAMLGGKNVHPVAPESSHFVSVLLGVDGWGFQIIGGNKVKEGGAFELDPTASPKRITLNGMVGIYSLEGDRLVIAFNTVNANWPPSDFVGQRPFEMVWHLERIKTAK